MTNKMRATLRLVEKQSTDIPWQLDFETPLEIGEVVQGFAQAYPRDGVLLFQTLEGKFTAIPAREIAFITFEKLL